MHNITLIPGDGIGPEITEAVKKIIKKAGVKINWEEVNAGLGAMESEGTPLPDSVIESIKKNKVALKAPITTPVGGGFRSVNVAIRKKLNLYANIRPSKTFDGVENRYDDIDLVTVRENTEGLYSGVEHYIGDKIAAETIKIITRKASENIVRFAFEYAKDNNRKRVTALHKANIQKFTDGLFLDVAREIAKEYPEIEFDDRIIDNMCMQLVQYPEQYDVMVAPNFYGDIISDLCSGLVGGLGMAPGANIGENCAVFEAVHGSAPDIAGKDLANPSALLLSAIMMLNHIGETEKAEKIDKALKTVLKEKKVATKDLGGDATTTEFTDAIIEKL
ncbi:MAG: isocitrate dehydrogenase (NAD(+)) [Fusobacteriota bacterium]